MTLLYAWNDLSGADRDARDNIDYIFYYRSRSFKRETFDERTELVVMDRDGKDSLIQSCLYIFDFVKAAQE